jgi:hypothetical protein
VTGQTSTHLPQRVHASTIASTRPASAVSKVSVMRWLAEVNIMPQQLPRKPNQLGHCWAIT